MASKHGKVCAVLWTDRQFEQAVGRPPILPEAERRYLLERVRYVDEVSQRENAEHISPDWILEDENGNSMSLSASTQHMLSEPPPVRTTKVVVTGCFDFLHSGHARFFEEAAAYGSLTVVVGSDRNVRELKGPGHPRFGEGARQYLVSVLRPVDQALVSSGAGWMDAAPEIERIEPEYYVVNDDGDRPEKRRFCQERGLRYVVLKRRPAPGLPERTSTELRNMNS